ncbi:hypothetical protein P8V03_19070, partial [Clostridium sp. A1-XYC3]
RDILDNSQKDEIRYSYEYDNEGNLAYHEDGVNFRDYKYSYDLSDRLVRIDEYDKDIGTSSYGETYSTKFDYDMSNNHSIITEKIDEKLYETRYGYDKDNKPVGVFYDSVIEDSPNFEYFHLSTNTTGSRGKTPIQETPIFGKDENDQGALYAYPGTKVIYDLGIDKKSGTMTAWVNTRNNTG